MSDSHDGESAIRFDELKNAASDADKAVSDLSRRLAEFDSVHASQMQRSLFQNLEVQSRKLQAEILQRIFQERDIMSPSPSTIERSIGTSGGGISIGALIGRLLDKAKPAGIVGGLVGAVLPRISDSLDPTTSLGLATLRDTLESLEAERENVLEELVAAEESLEQTVGLGVDDKAILLAPLQRSVESIDMEIEAVIDRLRQVIEDTISKAPEDVAKRLRNIDPKPILDELLSGTESVPEFRSDPRIDPRSPAFRDLHDRVGPEGGIVLPLPTDSLRDLNSRLEDTRDRLSFVRDEMQGVTAATGGFSNIIEGATGDTMLLGGAFDDLLVGADKASAGLQETLGQVLPELGDKTDQLAIKVEDNMARVGTVLSNTHGRDFGSSFSSGLNSKIETVTVALDALQAALEEASNAQGRFSDGLNVIEAVVDVLESRLDTLDESVREHLTPVLEIINTTLPAAQAVVRAFEDTTVESVAGAVDALLELTGADEGLRNLVGVIGQELTTALSGNLKTWEDWARFVISAIDNVLRAVQRLLGAPSAGAGGGGGGLGFLSSFFNPTSSAARPGGGFGAPGAVNPGPGFPVRLQHGGFAEAFRPAIVGESGPEMIVPHVPSTVIPNNALGGVTLNVSINAPGADRAGTDAIREEVRQLRGVVAALNSGIEPRALAAVSGKANRGGGFARTVGRRG